MVRQTPIADGIEATDINAQYDHACRKLLANREILARILKEVVDEFRDCDVEEIANRYIESQPEIASVPVNPGETNANIAGRSNEDVVYGEGKVTYDIHFQAVYPKGDRYVKIFINVEGQKDFYPGYALQKRGIFYCCRMISAQHNTEFREPHYDKIKKVYSIWICMNPSKKAGNTITRYRICKENTVGLLEDQRESYDLMVMVMICLGGEGMERYHGILKLLDVLLSREKTAKEKKETLESEFGIAMSEKMEKEVQLMCNFSEGLVEEVTREVTEKVEERFERLNLSLLKAKRYEDLERASLDKAYREQLCGELGI